MKPDTAVHLLPDIAVRLFEVSTGELLAAVDAADLAGTLAALDRRSEALREIRGRDARSFSEQELEALKRAQDAGAIAFERLALLRRRTAEGRDRVQAFDGTDASSGGTILVAA